MLDYSAKNNNILSSDPYELSFWEIGCTCYSFPGFEKKGCFEKAGATSKRFSPVTVWVECIPSPLKIYRGR